MREIDKKTLTIGIVLLSVAGMILRWTGIRYEGVDYRLCLSSWYDQLKSAGSLRGLAEYTGDYNLPYATALYFLTLLPIDKLVAIKLVSILFDFLEAWIVMLLARWAYGGERRTTLDLLVYGLVLCNPLAVVNSGYLAQSESIWCALALLSVYLILRNHPMGAMIALGCALGMKLQAIFVLPLILIYYFYKKSFSILHLVWVPLTIEVLCIPAIIGGCRWNTPFVMYGRMSGGYPFLYYYYPNVYTFFQDAPYYVFGQIAVISAFVVLLVFAILFVRSGRQYTAQDYVEYIMWTTFTCAMLLPCMHERYNYVAELLLPVCAVNKPKYRIPALLLVLISLQCNGQSYLGWNPVQVYCLAACNIVIYCYVSLEVLRPLYGDCTRKEAGVC